MIVCNHNLTIEDEVLNLRLREKNIGDRWLNADEKEFLNPLELLNMEKAIELFTKNMDSTFGVLVD